MRSQLMQISALEVRLGMFVSKLDRSWLETPFMFQGFLVNGLKEIDMLREYCDYVFIDKSINANNVPKQIPNSVNSKIVKTKTLRELFLQRQPKPYTDKKTTQEELKAARKIFTDLNKISKELFTRSRAGNNAYISLIKELVDPMVDSIARNPDAMIWMSNLKKRDNYSYRHSISASVWAVSLGRQLGLPKSDLRRLALGTLLCDIGKSALPSEILTKTTELSAKEVEITQKHVDYSLEILKGTQGIKEEVFEIVANHHERHAGHGYPKGLQGDEIPVFSRIAAIADCYDAIISDRHHAVACSSSTAMKKLYEWRDYEFQAELIEEFIQAIGIYPVGSLVELNTGEVCVVISEGRQLRLRPTVMQLLDSDKKPIHPMQIIDMKSVTEADDSTPLFIERSLSPGSYGIDPDKLYL